MTSQAPLPLPAGTILTPDPSLRRRDCGRLLVGGSPLRFIRLSDLGARVVSGWLRDEPVGDSAGSTRLARRLIDARMMHPIPPVGDHARSDDDEGGTSIDDVTIVIPVKDDAEGLQTTLVSLPERTAVIVVDDGSAHPVRPEQLPSHVDLIRRGKAGGPGVARQEALGSVHTTLIAFIDAGVVVPDGSLDRLAAWFCDRGVVAVGPRIVCPEHSDRLPSYERRHSPLDLGPTPAQVGPGSPVAYLPTACLVARASAVDAIGGFDPGLRWGEDVDLVWRLDGQGETRYDPAVIVTHPARRSLREFIDQRMGYGSAAAPLADRHGRRVAPVRLSTWSAATSALAFSSHPLLAIGLGAGTAGALEPKLRQTVPDAAVESLLLATRGHLFAGRSVAEASTRVWWPLTILAGVFGRRFGLRRAVLRLVAVSIVGRWLNDRGRSEQPLVDLALGIIDDAAYGAGVWSGAFRSRSLRALLPDFEAWPPRD